MQDPSVFYQTIGSRIREIRISKKLTFAKICEALEVSANDILRLDTPAAINEYPQEFKDLISGCSSSEIESILRVAKEVKSSIQKHKQE